MASVYLGRDGQLERRVAVKLLAASVGRDDELRRRFARESRLAARLSHPNVVAVFDAGEDDGRPYIVMEYVEGETLADVLQRRGALPPGEAAEIAGQVAAGLAHAHDQGLVHRDVKPQNVLVSGEGRAKIADFGVARSDDLSKLTQAGTVLGTAAYLSPEQAAGSEVGPASDVYALGVVLYELLAGETPYRFDSLADLGAPRKPPPPLPASVPPALADVVARCLAVDSAERPSAAEVERELRRSVAPASEAPTVRIVRTPRRHLVPVLALLALAAVAAVVTVLATRGRGNGTPTPAPIRPVPHSADTAQQARNLADWLRSYARK